MWRAAFAALCSCRCPYTSIVTRSSLCPSSRLISASSTPAAISNDAALCRRSWKRRRPIGGSALPTEPVADPEHFSYQEPNP